VLKQMPTFERQAEKTLGSLAAAVIGDALGAPTEQRSISEIRQLWGGRVEDFKEPPADSPYAKGRKAAQITDDSSQMIMLAEAFIEGGGSTTPRAVADLLLKWSDIPEYFPHFAGPSTRRAIDALRDGADPTTLGAIGREATMGTSNGGAMRVAPAGLVHPGDVRGAVEAAATTCQVSHYTRHGVAGAGAIAAAVAVAMCDGATLLDVVQGALRGADLGAEIGSERGRDTAGASVRSRTERAVEIAMVSPDLDVAIRGIADAVGTGLHAAEAVPAAIGFFVAGGGDPWATVVAAANAGDDTDTVACMAGAIAGAFSGFGAVRQDAYQRVVEANDLDLESLAERLVQVSHLPSNVTA
jgi:ADP-ribosylglycohydrolase